MRASVVNVRTAEHWDVYVGRGSCPKTKRRMHSVVYGNPFTGPGAVRLFLDQLDRNPLLVAQGVSELADKVLGCSCPQPCHATVWAMLANGKTLGEIRPLMLEQVAETRELFE